MIVVEVNLTLIARRQFNGFRNPAFCEMAIGVSAMNSIVFELVFMLRLILDRKSYQIFHTMRHKGGNGKNMFLKGFFRRK